MRDRRLFALVGVIALIMCGMSATQAYDGNWGQRWRDPIAGEFLAICDEEGNAVTFKKKNPMDPTSELQKKNDPPNGSVQIAGTGEFLFESTGLNDSGNYAGNVTIKQLWIRGEREGEFYDIVPGTTGGQPVITGIYELIGRHEGTMDLTFPDTSTGTANFTIVREALGKAKELFVAIPCTFPFLKEGEPLKNTTLEKILVRLELTRIGKLTEDDDLD